MKNHRAIPGWAMGRKGAGYVAGLAAAELTAAETVRGQLFSSLGLGLIMPALRVLAVSLRQREEDN